ncbi:hypothetical protein KM043_012148 [Ampulex compressa]|nr:hypothetical protein KM043_012148 [Ampulex compressa]
MWASDDLRGRPSEDPPSGRGGSKKRANEEGGPAVVLEIPNPTGGRPGREVEEEEEEEEEGEEEGGRWREGEGPRGEGESGRRIPPRGRTAPSPSFEEVAHHRIATTSIASPVLPSDLLPSISLNRVTFCAEECGL